MTGAVASPIRALAERGVSVRLDTLSRELIEDGEPATLLEDLWASTATKDPDHRDVLYLEPLAPPGSIVTVPEATLRAFTDHGDLRNEELLGCFERRAEGLLVGPEADDRALRGRARGRS